MYLIRIGTKNLKTVLSSAVEAAKKENEENTKNCSCNFPSPMLKATHVYDFAKSKTHKTTKEEAGANKGKRC